MLFRVTFFLPNTLQIRENSKKEIYVENLKEIEVTSVRDVIEQLIHVGSEWHFISYMYFEWWTEIRY